MRNIAFYDETDNTKLVKNNECRRMVTILHRFNSNGVGLDLSSVEWSTKHVKSKIYSQFTHLSAFVNSMIKKHTDQLPANVFFLFCLGLLVYPGDFCVLRLKVFRASRAIVEARDSHCAMRNAL